MKAIKRVIRDVGQHWWETIPGPKFVLLCWRESVRSILVAGLRGSAQIRTGGRPSWCGEHPHRGFETVTIVYQGELEHRDSSAVVARLLRGMCSG